MRTFVRIAGQVLLTVGTVLALCGLASLVYSRVLFVEIRLLLVAMGVATAVVGYWLIRRSKAEPAGK